MPEPRVEREDVERLVAAARLGDRGAFEALVRLYQDEVYTLAVRLTGNRDLASDVAQEAFIRAWQAIPRFRGDAAFSTWLHRITVNTAWTLKRRATRRATRPLDETISVPSEDVHTDPERMGESWELREAIKDALREIPQSQRSVVVLKDVYGWSHAEVADALGISVTAAKVRLHRGHARLRRLLEVTDDE